MADPIDSEAAGDVAETAEGPGHGIAEPRTHADKRRATGGASSMFSGGKSAEEKKSRKWSIIGAVIGVLGIVIVLVLHSRSQAQSAGASTATTGTTPDTYTTSPTYGNVAGSGGGYSGYDSELQQIESQLGSLQTTLAASSSNTTASTTGTTAGAASSAQTSRLVGAGFYTPGGSEGYSPVMSANTYQALAKAGTPMYYQPAVGVYEPLPKAISGQIITGGTPYTNTPVYIKS